MEDLSVQRSLLAVASTALVLVLMGCSSSPAATQGPGATNPPGATSQPSQAAPSQAAPSQAAPSQAVPTAPSGPTGNECASIPTFSLTNPEVSFAPDTALEAHFPASIDGSDATDVTSQSWLQLMCMFGGQAMVDQSKGELSGVDLTTASYGSATYTVDGEDITLNALRTPGSDANTLAQSLAQLAALSGDNALNGTLGTANISGKNVFVFTDATDGTKSYAYASGDTIIFTETLTDSQAQKVFAAMP
jgi:hypothetical protein